MYLFKSPTVALVIEGDPVVVGGGGVPLPVPFRLPFAEERALCIVRSQGDISAWNESPWSCNSPLPIETNDHHGRSVCKGSGDTCSKLPGPMLCTNLVRLEIELVTRRSTNRGEVKWFSYGYASYTNPNYENRIVTS